MPIVTGRVAAVARTAVLWLPVPALAGWIAVLLSGWDSHYPLTQLVSFTPYAAAGSVVLLAVALGMRRWRAAAVVAVLAAVLAIHVVPRGLADDGGATAGPRLRVLTSNMQFGGADPAAIVGLVRTHRVDLLALQEFTWPARQRLAEAGLDDLLPHAVTNPSDGANGTAVYSRYPVRFEGLRERASTFDQMRLVVSVPGTAPLAVESVHPCAPWGRPAEACWSHDVADQPPAGGDRLHLLLGDFNATLDHEPLRRVIATGYRDAADATGNGFVPTWPFDGDPVPPVTIDHVLVDRRARVVGYEVYTVSNTDHRAVYAELILPPG
jgi:endonuclease/exonuclease/phosphatase (EEP) superfamily protein YafD